MSQLTYTGSEYCTPSHVSGYGTPITTPATKLSSMVSSQFYIQEVGGDEDVILLTAGDKYLCSLYKSLVLQRLVQSFVFRTSEIAGQYKIRLVHRTLCTTFTLESAMRCVGLDLTVSDDFSGTMNTINQQLAPHFFQIFKN